MPKKEQAFYHDRVFHRCLGERMNFHFKDAKLNYAVHAIGGYYGLMVYNPDRLKGIRNTTDLSTTRV